MAAWLMALALCLAGGCAHFKSHDQPVKDITPERQVRKADVVRDFDQQRDRAQLESAIFYRDHGDVAACRETLESLLHRHPQHRQARFLLAELHFLNDRPGEARTLLEALAAEEPHDPQVQHLLGMVLDLAGDKDRAASCLLRAVELEPHNEVYRASYEAPLREPDGQGNTPAISAAVTALRRGAPQQALELLRSVEAEQSANAAFYRTLGTACYRAGNYPAAEAALAQALRLDNASALSYFLLGSTLSRQGRAAEAAESFRQAAALDPRYSQSR